MAGPFPTSPNDGDLHTTDGGTHYQYKVDHDRWVIYKLDVGLDDLSNVNSAGKIEGDALVWDVSEDEWVPGEAGVGAHRLDEHSAPNTSVAMGTQKLTGLAAGTTSGDSVRYEQLHSKYTNGEAVSAVEAAGLALDNGKVITSQDADLMNIFGRTQIGHPNHNDNAAFSHRDMTGVGQSALLQTAVGATYLNAATGRRIYNRINNVEKMSIDTNGMNLGGSGARATIINTSFVDNDTSLMTSASISNKIENYGYNTDAGSVSAVEAAGLALADSKSIKIDAYPASNNGAAGLIAAVDVDGGAYGQCLYLKNDGDYALCDADDATMMPCSAIMADSATGSGKKVLFFGVFRHDDYNFGIIGGPVYVATNGEPTTDIIPSGSGDQIQRIGIALATDYLLFMPSMDVGELA